MQVRRSAQPKKATRTHAATQVAVWHAREAHAWQERLEREAEHRMSLLKQQDFNAYVQAIQEHSSKHVDALLGDTDSCLRSILSRLQLRDGAPAALTAGAASCTL